MTTLFLTHRSSKGQDTAVAFAQAGVVTPSLLLYHFSSHLSEKCVVGTQPVWAVHCDSAVLGYNWTLFMGVQTWRGEMLAWLCWLCQAVSIPYGEGKALWDRRCSVSLEDLF